VSLPFTTSRARMRSASPCLTFEPVRGDFVPFAETHAHVVEKGLGAEIHVDRVSPGLHQQVGNFFLAAFWRQFHFLHGSFHFCLGVGVVIGRVWLLVLLRECRPKAQGYKNQGEEKYSVELGWITHGSPFQGMRQKPGTAYGRLTGSRLFHSLL